MPSKPLQDDDAERAIQESEATNGKNNNVIGDQNNNNDDDDDEEDEEKGEDLTASIDLALTTFHAIAAPLSVPSAFTSRPTTLATPITNLEDEENDASFSKPPTPPHTNVTKCYFSPVSYKERLKTFGNPMNYFAKPNMLSPLICARFGWTNISKDILQCTHPKCNATICITFHPLLSSNARHKLSCTYRKMLATSHLTICPFRSDAERWLRVNEYDSEEVDEDEKAKQVKSMIRRKGVNDTAPNGATTNATPISNNNSKADDVIVPPYLLPMSKEFQIFEDLSYNYDVTKRTIRDNAIELDDRALLHLEKSNVENNNDVFWNRWCVGLPKEVMDWYCTKFPIKDDLSHGSNNLDVASSLSSRISKSILAYIDNGDDDSVPSPEMKHRDDGDETCLGNILTTDDETTAAKPTDMSAVLTAFGWSPLRSEENISCIDATTTSSCCLVVQCQLCLARALISPKNVDGNGSNENDCSDIYLLQTTVEEEKKEYVEPAKLEKDTIQKKNVDIDSDVIGNNDGQQQQVKRKRSKDPFSSPTKQRTEEDELPPKKRFHRMDKSPTSHCRSGIQDTTTASKTPTRKEFNVVTSHRFFCPYICGFGAHDVDDKSAQIVSRKDDERSDSTLKKQQQPGWKIVLEKVLKCEKSKNQGIGTTRHNTFVESSAVGKGDVAFHFIQNMLQGSNF